MEWLRDRLPVEFRQQQRELHKDDLYVYQYQLLERPGRSSEHDVTFDQYLESAEVLQQMQLDYARIVRDKGKWRRWPNDPRPGKYRGPDGPEGSEGGSPRPAPKGPTPSDPSGGGAAQPEPRAHDEVERDLGDDLAVEEANGRQEKDTPRTLPQEVPRQRPRGPGRGRVRGGRLDRDGQERGMEP